MNRPRPAGPPEPPPRHLAGRVMIADPSVRADDDGRLLTGGSPLRLVRLTAAGAATARRILDGAPVPDGAGATALTRRLLDGGLVHPTPSGSDGPAADRVTIVVPTLGDPPSRLLDALASASPTTPVVIVDDGSAPPVADPGRPGVAVVRRETNGGPGAARNTGLTTVTTPFVAFVDADCEPPPGWLDALLPHFADPLVAAVAPRIVGPPAGPAADGSARARPARVLARYESVRGALDLGPAAARVRARSRVSYVPSAALVVRTEALRSLGGFDESLRVGEDVDLVWRLDEAGWVVRYEPRSTVAHHHRTRPIAWARRRVDYGRSAGPLARRHPGALVPLEASGWSLAAWALLGAGHPVGALVAAAATIEVVRRRLPEPGATWPRATRLVALGHVATGRQLAEAVVRPGWPVALAAATVSRRARRVVMALAIGRPLVEWARTRPPLDPLRWVALRVADDVAYGTGVWLGAAQARTFDPLVPELTRWPRPGRYTRWRTDEPDPGVLDQPTATRSTTKTSVSPPLITPPAPRSP